MYLLEVFGMTSYRSGLRFRIYLRLPNFINARVGFQGNLEFAVSVGAGDNSSDFYSLTNLQICNKTR